MFRSGESWALIVLMPDANALEFTVANGSAIFEFVGILAFALSGLLEAARRKLDIVGMAMVAAFAAFGGGTLRDILLDRRPFFWVQNPTWIYAILILTLLALVFLKQRHIDLTSRAVQWPDAVGLGIFSAGGTQIALESHVDPIIAVIMGIFTAMFGGVLRDIAVNQIPRAFSDHQPYSVIAFFGSWIVVLGDSLGWPSGPTVVFSALVIIVLRVMAILRKWRLPSLKGDTLF